MTHSSIYQIHFAIENNTRDWLGAVHQTKWRNSLQCAFLAPLVCKVILWTLCWFFYTFCNGLQKLFFELAPIGGKKGTEFFSKPRQMICRMQYTYGRLELSQNNNKTTKYLLAGLHFSSNISDCYDFYMWNGILVQLSLVRNTLWLQFDSQRVSRN